MTFFSRLNVLHFILLCRFFSIILCANDNLNGEVSSSSRLDSEEITDDNSPTSLLSHLRMKIITEAGHPEHLNMELVTRSLANKYLPVWMLKGVEQNDRSEGKSSKGSIRIIPVLMPEVMNKLGGFTMYQESKCMSAAVYFHRRRQFDGVIDYRYVIQGLSIDDVDDSEEKELRVNETAIVSRERSIGHQKKKKNRKHQVQNTPDIAEGKKPRRVRSFSTYDGRPEILVIVSWEMAQQLIETENEYERYTSIVSYVLTLFNGVDMLYSKLRDTRIQLNIAGIIFGIERESFAFMEECIIEDNIKERKRLMTRTECANSQIRKYLYRRRKVIPIESYDIVVFLTSNRLFTLTDEKSDTGEPMKKKWVKGQAASYRKELYKCREDDEAVILVATIRDDGRLGSYSDIAHESAHLMTVPHDPSPLINHECHANIMKKGSDWFHIGGGWCTTCLSWSDTSEKIFKAFFSSRNCCTFINEPRSLHPPQRRQMLTADEQCQCYGHGSATSLSMSWTMAKKSCRTRLQCMGNDNRIHSTVFPMDGTPCAPEKVCWMQRCRTIKDCKAKLPVISSE